MNGVDGVSQDNPNKESVTDQLVVRRQKMNDLRERGVDPFGGRYDRTHLSSEVLESFEEYSKEELSEAGHVVKIAGRIMTKRGKGKAGFAHLKDKNGLIQIYVRKDAVGDEQYESFQTADLGDFLGIEGTVMKTNTGEVTVRAEELTFLSKALRPLPDKYHGLTNVEQKY